MREFLLFDFVQIAVALQYLQNTEVFASVTVEWVVVNSIAFKHVIFPLLFFLDRHWFIWKRPHLVVNFFGDIKQVCILLGLTVDTATYGIALTRGVEQIVLILVHEVYKCS